MNFSPRDSRPLEEEDSDARGASSFARLRLPESEGGGAEEREAAQVRATLGVERGGVKVAAVFVVDGFPSMVMPWDWRAFRCLELETLSHFCPPSGAALILVPGNATRHQWLRSEEWAP